ncbi:hypothetical protein [Novilysobacter arseniciresistens]|uniref:hypothetical protein n=1 Tax=Novilysobacter arseniciresistens TaxID=1385522 RepID=UPI0009DD3C76|nr:hypothetical protein [Lysobacter arseniciresistens]
MNPTINLPISRLPVLAAAVLATATACTPAPSSAPATPAPDAAVPVASASRETPADTFMANLGALCGQAFAGRIVADTPPPTGDDAFAGKALVMHVRECGDDAIRVPFHVGEDRSRTWVLTRTDTGLRLKHDHRHEDGSADAITMYGGDTVDVGSATRQEFPVDAGSVAMFTAADMTASNSNTWAMELQPGDTFVYELSRPGGRLFRVEFDLTRPVAPPPPPWGATG